MQSIWSESWKSSEFITTKIAFTSRSVAALQEKDLANRRPPMRALITTLGGTIAAVCSRCQSQRNYEFVTHRQNLIFEFIEMADQLDQHAAIAEAMQELLRR